MSLSKKDFIQLAQDWSSTRSWMQSRDEGQNNTVQQCVETFTDFLVQFCRSQNPRFDSGRWLSYLNGECGPNGGKLKKEKS